MLHRIQSTFSPFVELSSSELENLRHCAWQIDCPNMILKTRVDKNPATYYGSGLLRQDNEGQLIFKLFSTRERNTPEWEWDDSPKTGEIIPEYAFYDLIATDFKARSWKASRFLPNFSRSATGRKIIDGKISSVSCKGKYPPGLKFKGSQINFWVFDDIKIPCNARTVRRISIARGRHRLRSGSLNAWKFRCLGIDFLLVKEEEDLFSAKITKSIGDFQEYFEDHFTETLQFVLGQPIHWTAMQKQSEGSILIVIASKRRSFDRSQFLPPLPSQLIRDPNTGRLTTAYHRRLFHRFLKHTLYYPKKRHPLWGKTNAVYEASSASFIDAKALTLTVAIESLLNSEFPKLGKPSRRMEKSMKDLQIYIREWGGNDELKKRLQGSISQFFQPRALDKMRELARRGVITDDQWKAWRKLRNPSTHEYQSISFPPDEFLSLIQKAEVLFYRLIFYAIGYKGLYTDFSAPDWPLREFPSKEKNENRNDD